MKKLVTTIAVLMGILWVGCGYADELTIQFQSGKTQRVTLDETADAVENIQVQMVRNGDGGQAQKPNIRYLYVKTAAEKDRESPGNGNLQQGEKEKSKWKWASPKVGE